MRSLSVWSSEGFQPDIINLAYNALRSIPMKNLFESKIDEIKTDDNAVYLEAVAQIFNILFEDTIGDTINDADLVKKNPRMALVKLTGALANAIDEAKEYKVIANEYVDADALSTIDSLVHDDQVSDYTYFKKVVDAAEKLKKATAYTNKTDLANNLVKKGLGSNGIKAFVAYYNGIRQFLKKVSLFTPGTTPSMFNPSAEDRNRKNSGKDTNTRYLGDKYFNRVDEKSSRVVMNDGETAAEGGPTTEEGETVPAEDVNTDAPASAPAPASASSGSQSTNGDIIASSGESSATGDGTGVAGSTDAGGAANGRAAGTKKPAVDPNAIDTEGNWLGEIDEMFAPKPKKPGKKKSSDPKEEEPEAPLDTTFIDVPQDHLGKYEGVSYKDIEDLESLASYLKDSLKTVLEVKARGNRITPHDFSIDLYEDGLVTATTLTNEAKTMANVLLYCLFMDAKKHQLVSSDDVYLSEEVTQSVAFDNSKRGHAALLRFLTYRDLSAYEAIQTPDTATIAGFLKGNGATDEVNNAIAGVVSKFFAGFTADKLNYYAHVANPRTKAIRIDNMYSYLAAQIVAAVEKANKSDIGDMEINLDNHITAEHYVQAMRKANLAEKAFATMDKSVDRPQNTEIEIGAAYNRGAQDVVELCRNEMKHRTDTSRFAHFDLDDDAGEGDSEQELSEDTLRDFMATEAPVANSDEPVEYKWTHLPDKGFAQLSRDNRKFHKVRK